MSTVITPTVGRKVWYRPSKFDGMGSFPMAFQPGRPLDATIVAVWGDRMVNVQVLDMNGKPYPLTSVTLLQEGDEPQKDADGNTVGRYVEWMPYQQGRAKKAEREDAAAVAVAGSAVA